MAKRKGPTLTCKTCGRDFHVPPVRASTARYCSQKCHYSDERIGSRLTKNCLQCGKSFRTFPSHNNDYCSYRCKYLRDSRKVRRVCAWCRRAFFVKQSVPDMCCSWECRVNKIQFFSPPETIPYWQRIRAEILERDGYCCQDCKLFVPSGSGLHVHHRVHRKNGGSEDRDNLITLCNPCHRRVHRTQKGN